MKDIQIEDIRVRHTPIKAKWQTKRVGERGDRQKDANNVKVINLSIFLQDQQVREFINRALISCCSVSLPSAQVVHQPPTTNQLIPMIIIIII